MQPPSKELDESLGPREIRGYIQGNCAHCHNGKERVDLREDVFLRNTLNRTTRGFMFPAGPRIKPGHPDESMVYLAMAGSPRKELSNANMPPVGVQQRDQAMIEKLRAWIASLADQSPPAGDEPDAVSRHAVARRSDAAAGYVPNRHASSLMNPHPYPLGFERIALDGDHSATRGFTALRFLPATNLFLLAEHEGRVSLYELQGQAAQKRGDFRVPGVCANVECGLVSMELDPDFAANALLYAGYCAGDPAHVKVSRLRLNRGEPGRTAETLAEILSVDIPDAHPWHTIGALLFDRSKKLWVMLGERGLGGPAQDLSSLLGSVIRIEPRRGAGESGYDVPHDNPRGPGRSSRADRQGAA